MSFLGVPLSTHLRFVIIDKFPSGQPRPVPGQNLIFQICGEEERKEAGGQCSATRAGLFFFFFKGDLGTLLFVL